mmetsp:Transcript_28398/g.32449  ORF Transcript_28398/g.32449 Transcript_28398/m.32449 type:complete len:141 (-) Transcript_28398:252-674(-)
MAPSCKVPLPTGSLKVAFKGDIPKVSGVDQASPMYGAFKIGYTVLELELGDGTVMQGLDTRELVAALNEHSNDPKRRMKMEMTLPKESVIVLQAGEHGLIIEAFGNFYLFSTIITYLSVLFHNGSKLQSSSSYRITEGCL